METPKITKTDLFTVCTEFERIIYELKFKPSDILLKYELYHSAMSSFDHAKDNIELKRVILNDYNTIALYTDVESCKHGS